MNITFDNAEREKSLAERGSDFALVAGLFSGRHTTMPDERVDYGEARFTTAG